MSLALTRDPFALPSQLRARGTRGSFHSLRAARAAKEILQMRRFTLSLSALALCCSMQLANPASGGLPMDQSFTYQGRLTYKGGAVDGPADLTFKLYDAVKSPFAIAVATSAMLRTWPVRFEAIELTLSVRSFHVPA